MKKSKLLLTVFFSFLKIGAISFGGGYAVIAFLQREFVEKRHWVEKEEFLDMTAIAESTPGPIAINAATYIGYRIAGVWGAVLATIGVCIPSFAVIYAISLFFDAFLSLTYVAYAFRGIQVCVVYLILSAGIRMWRDAEKTALSIAVFSITLLSMIVFTCFSVTFSSILYIIFGAAAGICVYLIRRLRRQGVKKK